VLTDLLQQRNFEVQLHGSELMLASSSNAISEFWPLGNTQKLPYKQVVLTFEYPAIRLTQVDGGKKLVLFGAPAHDIEKWGGIPQKGQLGSEGVETTGFQRQDNPKRLQSLAQFYRDPSKVG
jgi:hypothetical protein